MKNNFPYKFKNNYLFKTALTHCSYLNEHDEKNLQSNERLEFLGDAVLELIISLYLFDKYPLHEEGKLTAMRAQLVQTKTLGLAAQRLRLGEKLRLSKGEEKSGGRTNPSILADTFEAIVGAIYKDSNYSRVEAFTKKYLITPAEKKFPDQLPKNYKSSLQEEVQAQGQPSPQYKTLKEQGPDHAKTFQVGVIINGENFAEGKGHSKQKAEQKAARKALHKLNKVKNKINRH
jgi:ribonuclease-3